MAIEIGHFAALTALVLALLQWVAPLWGLKHQRPVWVRVGRQAAFAACLLLTLAAATVVYAFLAHDFSVRYVAMNSSLKLPLFYLTTALWGGHEGSLLLWAWLLSLFSAIAAWRHWSTHPQSMPYVLSILGAMLVGFLVLVLFLSSPFARLFPPPLDGRDLNPLLQDPGMVFHPPFLYMGYVGFAIPYAFAMASLLTGRGGEEWLLATRRWTLFSWAMLTTGIVFGGYWAYYELGWGGYWAWDPVENASFMPWLTATAFFHSAMVQERRGLFRIWNLFLIIATFALSLLGTFLVRSGVLSSVHAFASDPGRGVFILVFMSVVLVFSFWTLAFRSDRLSVPVKLETPLCKESAFLFNNLFFVAGAFTVLLGTLYPLAVETLSEAKVSVGAPYYNKVFIPIMLGMLLLMGIGPLIPWRRSVPGDLRRLFLLPAMLAALGVAAALAMDIRHPFGVLTAGLIAFVLGTHGEDLVRGVAARRSNRHEALPLALGRLVGRNKRRYGGFLVHAGVLVMAAGFIGSGLFQEERTLLMAVGDSARIGHWQLTLKELRQVARQNWKALEAEVTAVQDDGTTLTLLPQKRVYNEHSQPTTEAAIRSFFWEDLYVVLGDEAGEQRWAIKAYRNPLVGWVWHGTLIMALGVGVALMQGRRLRRLASGAKNP